MPQKHMECFRLLFDHLAWIEHRFLSGIRDSRKAGSLLGMMRGVGGVRKSIHHSWLTVSQSPYSPDLAPLTFGYSLSSQAVVMRQLRRWNRLWRRSLTRSHKRTSMGAFQKFLDRYNECIAAGGNFFEGDYSFMCAHTKKFWKLIWISSYL